VSRKALYKFNPLLLLLQTFFVSSYTPNNIYTAKMDELYGNCLKASVSTDAVQILSYP
jgi:hypothetical protein